MGWTLGKVGWRAPRGRVIGIAFVTVGPASGSHVHGDQVFPSADGIVEFWRDGDGSGNWFATPHAGEARFSEYEFLNTDNASANGFITGRGALQENPNDDGDGPAIYLLRKPAGGKRVWRFRPITGDAIAASGADTSASSSGFDVAARDYSTYRGFLVFNTVANRYVIRRWPVDTEGVSPTFSPWWTFSVDQEPEAIDLEDIGDIDTMFWAAGDDGSGNPFVMRCDDDETTWTYPTITGYSWDFVDTIQCVGTGEAIGLSENLDATGSDDALTFWRFTLGESEAADISGGVTVDGIDYRTWAAANVNNILVRSGVKMAVLGDRVAALTSDGTILRGLLIRS